MSVQDKSQVRKSPKELSARLAKLLAGREVSRIMRADKTELAIEFDDGTRLFARVSGDELDISVM